MLPILRSNLEFLDYRIVETELRLTRHLEFVHVTGMDSTLAARFSLAISESLKVLWERRRNLWRATEALDLWRRPLTPIPYAPPRILA
jgi:hypothetical protein